MALGEVERMTRRQKLHTELLTLGARKTLFQPPPDVLLEYPAIVYTRKSTYTQAADNKNYKATTLYQIELIDPDPDSPLVAALLNKFKMITHVNNFKASNLNHDVFNLYY